MKKPSKPKLSATSSKTKVVGASPMLSASKNSSPLAQLAGGGKKDYKKPEAKALDFGTPGFGETGLTGES